MNTERVEVRKPLQAILIAPDKPGREQRDKILSGEKTLTVRPGFRDYHIGKVILCCHLEPWAVQADIIEVKHALLHEVTDEEVKADGVKGSLTDLWADLKEFYPKITLTSAVTIVRWSNLQGKLVNEYKKSKGAGQV